MTSPRKPAKQSSGWGGFLQQAVLSVESRLDTILADEEQSTTKPTSSGNAQESNGRGRAPHGLFPLKDADLLLHSVSRYLEKLVKRKNK
jgi:hypothetical protein